jgi:hypothetical protein
MEPAMEKYLEYLPLALFLLLVLGGRLLKRYIEKQQAEKEAAQRRPRRAGSKPTATPPAGRRPVFYGRTGERPAPARPQEPAPSEQTIVTMPPGPGRRPTPAATRPQVPPGVAVAGGVIRQKVQRRRAPARAAPGRADGARIEEPPKEAPAVGSLDDRHLESLGTGMVSALRGSELHPATERPTTAPAAGPRPAAGFLGSMLQGGNVARAVALSEILGPPRGLQDL